MPAPGHITTCGGLMGIAQVRREPSDLTWHRIGAIIAAETEEEIPIFFRGGKP